MEINWWQISISLIIGWILGILSKGVREVLSSKILSKFKSIQAGEITKSREDILYPSWYVPIYVNAPSFWKLLISGIENVECDAYFINIQDNTIHPFHAVWWREDSEVTSITLRIGDSDKIRIVGETTNDQKIRAIYGTFQNYVLEGDYDIIVRLKSGENILGRWLFSKAIINSVIQDVKPNRIGDKNDFKTTFPTYNF
jgi:hypothetical protein